MKASTSQRDYFDIQDHEFCGLLDAQKVVEGEWEIFQKSSDRSAVIRLTDQRGKFSSLLSAYAIQT